MLVIGHRGASGYAPENTHAAFERAIAMGCHAIETDVQLTADNELVLFHDMVLDRVSSRHGPLAGYTLAELRQLDLGVWFSSAFAGERIVTLDDALDRYPACIPLVLEIKDPRCTRPVVDRLIARDLIARTQVTSFFWPCLPEARTMHPDLVLGYLTRSFEDDTMDLLLQHRIQQICPHVDELSVGRVETAHGRGLQVRAWGIERREQVDLLFDTGADGATINWPDWILEPR